MTEAVRRLTMGSYEHTIAKLNEAIQRCKKSLFKEESIRVFGTFPGHAIVVAESGKFYRAVFEEKDGAFKVTGVSGVPVPMADSVPDFVRTEVQSVVEAFLAGKIDAARIKLEGVAPFVGNRKQITESQLTESVISAMKAEKPWRRLYQEQEQKIRKFLWGDLAAIQEAAVSPKFKKLYDGSMEAEEVETFRDLVSEETKELGYRLEALTRFVHEARAFVTQFEPKFRELGEDAIYTTFGAFSEDLESDLQSVSELVSESATGVSSVADLGKLFDAVAEALTDYEIAGRFVEKMAAKLHSSQVKEN